MRFLLCVYMQPPDHSTIRARMQWRCFLDIFDRRRREQPCWPWRSASPRMAWDVDNEKALSLAQPSGTCPRRKQERERERDRGPCTTGAENNNNSEDHQRTESNNGETLQHKWFICGNDQPRVGFAPSVWPIPCASFHLLHLNRGVLARHGTACRCPSCVHPTCYTLAQSIPGGSNAIPDVGMSQSGV